MTSFVEGVFADAAARWRIDRDLLIRVVGVFFFLPALAGLLFVPEIAPSADPAAEPGQALAEYLSANAPWLATQALIQLFGATTLFTLLLDRGRPAIGAAMRQALGVFPIFLLTSLAVSALVVAGGTFFFVPGFYVMGRTFMVSSVVIAEKQRNPIEAIARSIRLTRGRGWLLFGMAIIIFVPGLLLSATISSVERSLPAIADNPISAMIFAAASAAISAAVSLALLLIKVAAYRRLEASSKGM